MFRSRALNVVVGSLAGFVTVVPFTTWTRIHARHHKWTGWQDIDPTTQALVPRQVGLFTRVLVNVCWRCWIPLFSTLYRFKNYWNVRRLMQMFPRRDEQRMIRRSIAIHLLGYAALVLVVGPGTLVELIAVGVIVSLVIEDLLLLSQHTHVPQGISGGQDVRPVPALEQEVFTRSLRLPGWASTLLLNFDAHELHHMYPFVPGYYLRRIPYQPEHEIGWREWVRLSKRMSGTVLLFQNRDDTGIRI
jgi:fatty acid desaturase